MTDDVSLRAKLGALSRVVRYRPSLVAGVVGLSLVAALFEGIGVGFLLPIIEVARGSGTGGAGAVRLFVRLYDALGVPFELGYIVLGVGVVMTVRYLSAFLVDWLKARLQADYVRHLRTEGFDRALAAEVGYFDDRGSDEILNALLTQVDHGGRAIRRVVDILEQGLVSLVYLGIALLIAPLLTLLTGVALGGFYALIRSNVDSGYAVGNRLAEANERLQRSAQAGTQGIRDVKLFGLDDEMSAEFERAADRVVAATTRLRRNEAAMDSVYQLLTALAVFGLIYVAITYSSLALAELGVFLFAMFRLAPRLSTLNNHLYQADGDLPHLVRTQRFMTELDDRAERDGGDTALTTPVETVEFDGVSFGYGDGRVLEDVAFSLERGEFVALVGPSGSGKSTVVSLLARLYDPDEGRILADGTPVDAVPLDAWRDRVAVVRQQPYVFNDTLRYNLTVGNRDADQAAIERACRLARVTEFLDSLPEGYDTVLGDDGVRLSGGQRQRVSIARALLADADLLVLDEATSDLDTGLEEEVHSAIERSDGDYATLVVAHRLSTVVNADRIHVLDDGRIVESGTHDELLAADGQYAALYAGQV